MADGDPEVDRADREQRIRGIMRQLSGHTSSPEREQLERRAKALMTAKPSQYRVAELDLRHSIQLANDAADARAAEQRDAMRLRAELRGLKSSAVASLDLRLARVEEGVERLTAQLRRRVQEVHQQAKTEADRNYAAEVAAKVLTDLGYEVQEGFDTLVVEDGVGYFHRPEWTGHAVRLRLGSEDARMDFDVCQLQSDTGEPTASQAQELDALGSWCGQVAELSARFRDYGVILEVDGQEDIHTSVVHPLEPSEAPGEIMSPRRRRQPRKSTEA
jgi:hypothetical protein